MVLDSSILDFEAEYLIISVLDFFKYLINKFLVLIDIEKQQE